MSEETIHHKFSCLWFFVNTMTLSLERVVWESILHYPDHPVIVTMSMKMKIEMVKVTGWSD